jgi:monofunctional biosynthetic peptidoglycan transglycosylase
VNKTPPAVAKKPRPIPGEEFESTKPLPPLENATSEPSPASTEAPEPSPASANSTTANASPEQLEQSQNSL